MIFIAHNNNKKTHIVQYIMLCVGNIFGCIFVTIDEVDDELGPRRRSKTGAAERASRQLEETIQPGACMV